MALSTWLDATMKSLADDGLVPYGTLDARWNADRNVTIVTWTDGNKTVYLGEAPVQGKRLAMYRVVNDHRVIATIRKAEANARRDAAKAAKADHAEYVAFKADYVADDDLVRAAAELGIDLGGVERDWDTDAHVIGA